MAASTRWRLWRETAVIIAVLAQFANGYEESYSISQFSPKSVSHIDLADPVLKTSNAENLAFTLEPSAFEDATDPEDLGHVKHEDHIIVERSADPTRDIRSINVDEIPSSNNEIDSDIELHNRRKYYDIHPTKTVDYLHSNDEVVLSSFGDRLEFRFPGEGRRVPFGRALPVGPRVRPTAVQPIFATATPREEGRQNSEIQNIITGIVKLLNGNVNVQANSQLLNGRPRPMNSRINNRGPPRISDVPPLPDFDKPVTPPHSFVPTKIPPPYPFDRPPVHVNLPEQIVPPLVSRPSLHRPIPPWQRPRPRPPNRRPNPGLPMYKPNVPIILQEPEVSEEIPDEYLVNENENHSENGIHHEDAVLHEDAVHHEDAVLHEEPVHEVNTPEEPTPEVETEAQTERETTTAEVTTEVSTTTSTTEPPTTTEKTTTTEATTTTKATTKPTTTKPTTEKPKTEKIKPEKDKKKETPVTDKKDKFKIDDKPKVDNKTVSNVTTTTTESPIKNDTVPVIESSIAEMSTASSAITPTPTEGLVTHVSVDPTAQIESTTINSQPLPSSQTIPYHPYRPRPGIVLDDPDFKPKGTRYRPEAAVITAPAGLPPAYGEIFDVTVSAVQGPGEKASVHIETVNLSGHEHDDIIVSASGEQGFVSIDGKRTYLNLFDTTTSSVRPSRVQPPRQTVPPPTLSPLGQGVAIPADDVPAPPPRRPPSPQRPPQQGFRRPPPTVRIDTCIVGDDSTCDKAQNEKCRTEAGISSCQCRPGYARRSGRDPCRRVVSLLLSLRVDRIYDRKVAWDSKLSDKESEPYQQLSYEAVRAIDSAFSMTPFSDDFVSAAVNTVHRGDDHHTGVYVNFTILMQETAETIRPAITTDIQKHLLGAIRRRSNNIGSSVLWVDSVAGSVLPLHDVDECSSPDNNDCHQLATCTNTFGGFKCSCPPTTLDPRASLPGSEGRECKTCAASHCSERGQCLYSNGQPSCSCNRGYFGSRCEIDGEVIGAALGATLTAALVIGATLTALLSWSRKWSREQKAVGMGSPVFNYMASNTIKTPPVGQPPYQVTLEERMRWAQIAEAMVQANHYAPESQTMATRPSSAMFGAYPTLPPVPLPRMGLHGHHNATMNTVASRANTSTSHHNLYGYTNQLAESSSSEASSQAQDRADLLVPRPKSRARSMHNQTGIYYDVEYENAEPLYGSKGIPLSTYTVSRGPPFYRA